MMRQEVVVKRQWMGEAHFLDLIGATNLIPGPNSTEMAIHIGRERAGWKGLIVAGFCFIFPAVCITGFFAWWYKSYGKLPEVQPFLYGIKPAIIAVIIAAIFPLAKQALKTIELAFIGIVALIVCALGFNEIVIMFAAGFFAVVRGSLRSKKKKNNMTHFFPLVLLPPSAAPLIAISNFNLFFVFLKTGAILYGSGDVLFAFLDAELATKGLLSRQQLIDAIAVGQFTPGPVFSSVTFIGYQINGLSGAIVSTLGVFLPAFLFVLLLNPLVKRMRDSDLFSRFLDAVNIASVAIILSVCFLMAKESLVDWRAIIVACLSLIVVFKFKNVNSAITVLLGSFVGYVLTCI